MSMFSLRIIHEEKRMRKLSILTIFIFILSSLAYAVDLTASGGQASLEFAIQINLEDQASIGFTQNPSGVTWNSTIQDYADNSVTLSYSAASGETGQTPQDPIYFYYMVYWPSGCDITFTPHEMTEETGQYGSISYSIDLISWIGESEAEGENGVSSYSTISVGTTTGTTFSNVGVTPVIQIYELDFKLEESDFPAVMKGEYTGNITVSCVAK